MGTLLEAKINVYINDSKYTFNINRDLELTELKKKIQDKTNIPVEDQALFEYGSEPLLDYLCLKSLKIKSNANLYLYKKSELFKIHISCDDRDNTFNFTFLIHENMEIGFIRSMIFKKCKIKLYGYDRFSLIFNSIALSSSKLVKDYDIKDGSLLVADIEHLKG